MWVWRVGKGGREGVGEGIGWVVRGKEVLVKDRGKGRREGKGKCFRTEGLEMKGEGWLG